jgi:hypothetical protein
VKYSSAAATFISVTALVAFISWWRTRRQASGSAQSYFLANRRLPWIQVAGSLLLTNLSTEQLIGLNGAASIHGAVVMAWEVVPVLALIALAWYFLPRYWSGNITTIPEFLERRFDRATRRLMAAIMLFAIACNVLPFVLYSGGIAMSSIFRVPEHLGMSVSQATLLMSGLIASVGAAYVSPLGRANMGVARRHCRRNRVIFRALEILRAKPMKLHQAVSFLIDTQGANCVGCYRPDLKLGTPHIDRLAASGVRFDRAYTCAPVCGPARAAIFTGLYPHSNGVLGNDMSPHLAGSDYFGTGQCPPRWQPEFWMDGRNYFESLPDQTARDLSRRTLGPAEVAEYGITAEFTHAWRIAERGAIVSPIPKLAACLRPSNPSRREPSWPIRAIMATCWAVMG